MPLRQSEIQASFDAQELQVQVVQSGISCNGSLSQSLPQYADPCDPTPRNGRSQEVVVQKAQVELISDAFRTSGWSSTRRWSLSSALWSPLS